MLRLIGEYMSGRVENEIKTRKKIKKLLEDMPQCVNDFYYNIQVSLTPRTCLEYVRCVKNLIEYIGTTDVVNISDVTIGEYFSDILYITKSDGSVVKSSEAYRKYVWSSLNHFYTYLYKKGEITRNPMDLIARPNKKDVIERKYLSINELNAMLKFARPHDKDGRCGSAEELWKNRDFLILYIFMMTGMRCTALSEIDVDDINFIERKITVIDKRDTIQVYTITPELKIYIKRWLKIRTRLLRGEQCNALFISRSRKRMTSSAIKDTVGKYSMKALGRKISPHKLRAAFTTLYYEASGHDIEATRKAVGHADISTTSIYITTDNDDRADAARYMSDHLLKID